MYGEITIEIKKYKQQLINNTLEIAFGPNNKLPNIITNSIYSSSIFLHNNFFFGYQNVDSLFLVYKESNDLKIHVEATQNNKDLSFLRHLINSRYDQIRRGLKEQKVKINKSRALINIDQTNLTGEIKGRMADFLAEFNRQKYRLVFLPLGIVLAALLFSSFGGESSRNQINASIYTALGAYLGIILWTIFEFLISKMKTEFDFKFLN